MTADDIDFQDFHKWMIEKFKNLWLEIERFYDCADTYVAIKHNVIPDNNMNKDMLHTLIELGLAEEKDNKYRFSHD